MPIPANVKTKIQTRSHNGHGILMKGSRANVQSSNNIVRHAAARQTDEPSAAQAASVAKILRQPL